MPPQQTPTPVVATPRPHEHDQVAVTNVDVDCNESTVFTVERSIPVPAQPGENNPMNIPRFQSIQQETSFDHSQFFEVRYNSQPFQIKPGETRLFPRYIAEHFAKHLADHMLQKMEDEEERKARSKQLTSWRKGLVQSSVERPKMLARILETKVWFLEGALVDPYAQPQVDNGIPATDLGVVPNYAVGQLKAEPKTAEQILADVGELPPTSEVAATGPAPQFGEAVAAPTPTDAAGVPLGPESLSNPVGLPAINIEDDLSLSEGSGLPTERTKSDLIKEAVLLDIPVTGRESVEELKRKIQGF